MNISTIDGYGGRFQFEPPVEVGERENVTLQTLAALAVVGVNAPDFIYETADTQIGALLRHTGSSPQMAQAALSALLKGKHEVTLI